MQYPLSVVFARYEGRSPVKENTLGSVFGLISHAVVASTDTVFSFRELMLLPCFVGSLPFGLLIRKQLQEV